MNGFREGYSYFQESTGVYFAASQGAEYVSLIISEIDRLVL
jgi:hypothetical protein